ncbi:MAG: DUF4827 domain-containing protein [Paludibacteraceae bacterium]|nr:DUF4827 domain-containing protein [Paludibacteraceae bacterium]
MLRYIKFSLLVLLLGAMAFSCSEAKSYADYVNEEKDDINSYVERSNIEVVTTKPQGDGEWISASGKPIYYKDSYGLYYHQISKGTGTLDPVTGSNAYVRYVGYTLDGVMYYNHTSLTYADPIAITLSSSPSGKSYGVGFQTALRNMCAGGHCKVIIPFSIGNGNLYTVSGVVDSDIINYRPMAYEIWLVNVE